MTGTMTSKILRAHGVSDMTPGQLTLVPVDLVVLNDVSGPVAITQFERMGAQGVFDVERVVCIADHFWPAKDARSAAQVSRLREFARASGIADYWETGSTIEAGIEHAVLAERGRARPGMLIVGGDSHTCTAGAFGAFATGVGSTDIAAALALGEIWIRVPEAMAVAFTGRVQPFVTGKDLILGVIGAIGVDGALGAAIEFSGSPVDELAIDERLALCNMAVEAGATTGMVRADEVTQRWLRDHGVPGGTTECFGPDADARYDREAEVDLDGIGPLVAMPPSPGNVASVEELSGVHVDQVYVGNCANGTMTDLRQLALMMENRKVAAGTRLIVVPATQRIYREAIAEGLVDIFLAAGAMVSTSTCGACFGGHMGVLAAGEVGVATTNRNFRGRMGHPESHVYLGNAYVAGAAAVTGTLTHPQDVLGTTAQRGVQER
ncbi:MAG: 3-isopropylmalate dehydratase large subunit [Solirubrobacteraceae bacterium]